MKGRGPYKRVYIDGTEVASRELGFLQRTRLLSQRGCDSVSDITEGDRKAECEDALDKESIRKRGYNYDLFADLEAYDEICTSSGRSGERGN